MSDFDEEAERERLREQYEREQQKREATEHMSDLLLKGATMTDAHCETCGDPIFRYDGQEFCPTCQERVGDGKADEGETDENESEAPATETAEQSGDEVASGSSESTEAGQSATSTTNTEQPSPSRTEPDSPAPEPRDGTATEAPSRQSHERVGVPTVDPEQGQQSPTDRAGDLADARESLTATLVTFARQAESTDDPRRAKDALEAAREAAETLDALEDVR